MDNRGFGESRQLFALEVFLPEGDCLSRALVMAVERVDRHAHIVGKPVIRLDTVEIGSRYYRRQY